MWHNTILYRKVQKGFLGQGAAHKKGYFMQYEIFNLYPKGNGEKIESDQ